MLGLVEPRCGRWPQQLFEAFHLLGSQQAIEDLVVVVAGDFLTVGYVAEFLVRRQEHRWRELRQVGLGDVDVDVDAFVLRVYRNPRPWEQHVSRRLQGVSEWLVGKQVALADLGCR